MRFRASGVMLLLMAAGLAWAGPASSHEKLTQTMLSSLDRILASLKGIETEDNAQAARPELRKAADQWVEARAQAAKLQPPEKEEKERLVKLYKPKFDQNLKRLFIEIQRVSVITGGKEALMEIAGVLKKDGKP